MVAFALFFGLALARPSADGFNSALAEGDLAGADVAVQSLIDGGAGTADVYFNLGNLRFRQARIPEAMLAWRCAERLAPRDPDVQANLDVVRRKIPGAPAGSLRPTVPAWAPWQAALTPEEGQWVGAWLAGMSLLALAIPAGRGGRVGPVGVAGLVLGALIGAGGIAAGLGLPLAVVQSTLSATSDLGGGSELFSLPAGAEVRVEAAGGNELRVALADGRRGWVSATSVAVVDARSGCSTTRR
ncbi:MAG: hypothetical protein EXR69_06785 [Myxococcales bacterium]|nr:hypothetical protein [Myxococcales bacterium]